MSLNETPRSSRTHIGIFGRINSGKSSLINAITNQDIAIVSNVLGTTTDPVYKAMELLPLGPIVLIDTPGLDDIGELGPLRIDKAKNVIRKCDIVIIVCDGVVGQTDIETNLISECLERKTPYLLVMNKADICEKRNSEFFYVSAITKENINELKENLARLLKEDESYLIKDLVNQNDTIILVTPIDSAAPKGRIILPQQQVLKEALDNHAVTLVVQEEELLNAIQILKQQPKLVITDSQAFESVAKIVPENIQLTSFSILFLRKSGNLEPSVEGAKILDNLNDGDTILISEGCTHHKQCDDIGTVKLPRWINSYCNKNINYEFTNGTHFPNDLTKYRLVIHCGGCMLNIKEIKYRYNLAIGQNVAITNYGITIAHINDILDRSIKPFEM